jgi:hypothetical protein
MSYNDFRKKQIVLQLTWREKQNISKEYGCQNGKQYPHIVPKSEWIKTVWPPLEKDLIKYLTSNNIQHHTGTHNLLSSWVLCSNLYFGTYINEDFKELFRHFLEEKLEIKIERIDSVNLEFAFEGKLGPANLLGESDGKRGSGQTSPDLAVLFSSQHKKGIVLVECKYTEHSFYNCSGRKTKINSGKIPNPNPQRCLQKEVMKAYKNNCHQYAWGRKYWEHLNISEYGLKNLKYCPACIGGYQLVRQQALAEGIVKYSNFTDVISCIAFDGRNGKIMQSMKANNINSIKCEWEKLYDLKSKFFVWEHQEWVKYVSKNCKEQFGKDWLQYIKDRYDMY